MIDVIAKHDIEYKDDKGVAQSAKAKQIVKMPKDEFDKLGRTVSLEQFGRWAGELRDGA